MSSSLFEIATSFVAGKISATSFSNSYIDLWRIERDNGILQKDESRLSECLSSIFCAADMYCADDELREVYEFDEKQLKYEVSTILKKYLSD